MNFNDYADKQNEKKEKVSGDMKEKLFKFLSSYEGKSEDELLKTIYKIAENNRKQGKLSDEEIDNFYSSLSGMLSDDKKIKLKELIEKIKKIK